MKVYSTILLLVLAGVAAQGQEQTPSFNLEALSSYFIGQWKGLENGKAGHGVGTRTYEMVLGQQFLYQQNTSHFEPQEKNPTGETHQDWAIFSYDKIRQSVVLREFHSEGFVNQYTLKADSVNNIPNLIFMSESIENLPSGWRAKVVLEITGPDTFTEFFELAQPDGDFEPFLHNRWTRKN